MQSSMQAPAIDAILALGSMSGDKEYHEFAKLVCPSLTDSDISEITRHMDRFNDWPESYLLDSIIDYLNLSDEQFMFFLEQYVNPKGCCYWAFSHRVLRLAGSLSSGDWTMRRERRVYQASEQAQRYAAGSNLFQRVL